MESRDFYQEIANSLNNYIRQIVTASNEIVDNDNRTFLIGKIFHCGMTKIDNCPELDEILSGDPFLVTTLSGEIRVSARLKNSDKGGMVGTNFEFWVRALELEYNHSSKEFEIMDSEYNESEERYLFKYKR